MLKTWINQVWFVFLRKYLIRLFYLYIAIPLQNWAFWRQINFQQCSSRKLEMFCGAFPSNLLTWPKSFVVLSWKCLWDTKNWGWNDIQSWLLFFARNSQKFELEAPLPLLSTIEALASSENTGGEAVKKKRRYKYHGGHPIEGVMPSPYLCERFHPTHGCVSPNFRPETTFSKVAGRVRTADLQTRRLPLNPLLHGGLT